MDARGLASLTLVEGAQRGSMDLLAEWTLAADKVMVY
jgi:sulfur relay (sulfurtransferase) complex TusBCD TusD component (DsrE family)